MIINYFSINLDKENVFCIQHFKKHKIAYTYNLH